MKKRDLYILITIFICGVLGILTEILIFNFKPLTSNEAEKSVLDVPYTVEKNDDKTTLNIKAENKYIRELTIEYNTEEDVEYSIDYSYVGAYGQDIDKTFDDIFDDTFAVAAVNLNATISNLSISFDSEPELKINKINIDNDFHFNYFRALFVSLALLIISCLFLFYKDGFRTEKLHIYFVAIAFLLGLMFIVAQPAMSFFCWDDQTHFDRVVDFPIGTKEFSHGEYHMSDGGTINHTWHESTNSYTESRIRSKFLDAEGGSGYFGNRNGTFLTINKVPYTPMAIGYHVAKFVKLPFTICFYVGKIFNLLFYILLMAYAIKTLVSGKRLLAVIALLPSNIFLASSYSYDPAVFAGITIFIVHLINILLDKSNTKKLTFETALVMIASMTYACLAKSVYAPIMLLVLLLPKEKFRDLRQSRFVKIGFMAISILLISVVLLPTLGGTNIGDTRGGDVSVKGQLSLVISHPTDYVSVLSDTAIDEFGYKLFSSNTITNFSYTKAFTDHSNFYYIFIILLIFVFLTDNEKNFLNKKQRFGILGIITLIIFLIWSALYLDFTPVGATTINGVQNRYFLPLLLPILFCLQMPNVRSKINPKYYNLMIFTISSVGMVLMIYWFVLVPYNF
ncbi:DUF2142 domain-containing protein [Candidatus Saccharibacteria bacterium]|nr:DUF2142 domain-containing protein [Candidatus Saccharibacteria bacterium]